MNVQIWSMVLGFEALVVLGLALRMAQTGVKWSWWTAFLGVLLVAAAWLRPEGWLAILLVGMGLAVIGLVISASSLRPEQSQPPQSPSLVPGKGESRSAVWAEALREWTDQCWFVVDDQGRILGSNQTHEVAGDETLQTHRHLGDYLGSPDQLAPALAEAQKEGLVTGLCWDVRTGKGVRAMLLSVRKLPSSGGADEFMLLGSEVVDQSPLKEELKAKERQLADSEHQYRKLLESVTDYVYRVEVVGGQPVRTVHSPGAHAVTGYGVSRFENDKNLWLQMVYEDDRPIVVEQARRALAGSSVSPIEHRIVHRNGSVRWIRNTMVVHTQNGVVVSYEGLITDVTERKMAEQALQLANDQLKSMNEELRALAADDALFNELQNSLSVCNKPAEVLGVFEAYGPRLFPESSGCLYRIGRGRDFIEAVCSWGDRSGFEVVVRSEHCWALRRSKPHGNLLPEPSVLCSYMKDAGYGYLCVPLGALGEALGVFRVLLGPPHKGLDEESLAKHRAAKASLAVKVADALSLSLASIDLREQLTNQAVRDSLTGLFNRRYLEETLSREVRRAARTSVPLSVVMLDIDHFKQFNDSFGHEMGDLALQQVATYLMNHFRGDDVACRFGGEEFMLVMTGASREDALRRSEEARSAIESLSFPCGLSAPAKLTASFGVATYPEDGADGSQLVQKADQALYMAKSLGRNRVVLSQQSEPAG